MGKYQKALAAVGAAVVSVAAAFGFDASTYVTVAISAITPVLVFLVPNA